MNNLVKQYIGGSENTYIQTNKLNNQIFVNGTIVKPQIIKNTPKKMKDLYF